jgi:hypothetical protein
MHIYNILSNLQTSAAFYIFELHDKICDTSDCGDIGFEREFTNIFRSVG